MAYDVAVIGGGAAGLSAALVLAQSQRRVVVVDAGSPRNAPADHVHGFLSRERCSPGELLRIGRAEVCSYGGEIITATVTGVRRAGDGFHVSLTDRPPVEARRLLVATGVRDELPRIPGLAERWTKDVLHCPYCHGQEVRDRPLGMLSTGPDGAKHALMLRQWSRDVTLFQQQPMDDDERCGLEAMDVRVMSEPIAEVLVEDDRLTGVRLANGITVPLGALFVMPGCCPNNALLTALACDIGEDGWVRVDADGRTSVPGVWAAGNVTDESSQVVNAAAAGLNAAVAINADLIEADLAAALDRPGRRWERASGGAPGSCRRRWGRGSGG